MDKFQALTEEQNGTVSDLAQDPDRVVMLGSPSLLLNIRTV